MTDAATALGLSGATVSTQPPTGTTSTDAQGMYTLSSVLPGQYVITIVAATYETSIRTVLASSGQTTTANFVLVPLKVVDLTVTSAGDIVNGDASSPRTLVSNPGADGISLREAITAANGAPGPHTITFAEALSGSVIALTGPLPPIRGDSMTIIGRLGADGSPSITLDGRAFQPSGRTVTLAVYASAIRLSKLRFSGVVSEARAVEIQSGKLCCGFPAAPSLITDIRIEDSLFDNDGISTPGYGINIGTHRDATNATISNITIMRCSFRHFQADATSVLIGLGGTNNRIQNVTVAENSFFENNLGPELGMGPGSGNRISGTRILRNYIAGALGVAIFISTDGTPGGGLSNHVIDSTEIAGNVVVRSQNGIFVSGGGNNAVGNAVLNTRVENNLLIGSGTTGSGMYVNGGSLGARDNRVQGIRIVNNTIAGGWASAMFFNTNGSGGATGNAIMDASITNTILWGNGQEFNGRELPPAVAFSLTRTAPFAGSNGNVSSDPLFADPGNGDFHLRTGSPAIGTGTNEGAPTTDLECRARVGPADMGAIFSGGTAACSAPRPFWTSPSMAATAARSAVGARNRP